MSVAYKAGEKLLDQFMGCSQFGSVSSLSLSKIGQASGPVCMLRLAICLCLMSDLYSVNQSSPHERSKSWDLVSALGHFPVSATGVESEQMDFYRLRNDVFGTCSRNMAIWEIHVGIGLLKLCSVNMENTSLLWALDAANRGALVRPFDCFRRWMALPSNV
ncbi:hypothetical protein ACOSQ4_025462 [Xanthoceras sorbifolium]